MGNHYRTSRMLLRASEVAEAKCKEDIVQTNNDGVQRGTIDVAIPVTASSQNATAQIFPRQTPVENATAQLDLVEDTCKGSFCYSILAIAYFEQPL